MLQKQLITDQKPSHRILKIFFKEDQKNTIFAFVYKEAVK